MATYDLHAALSKLDAKTRNHLDAHGFSADRLERLSRTLTASGDADARRDARNRVASVRPPGPSEIRDADLSDGNALATGRAALRAGKLAFCVMAGGMATRMGGVVKALVECAQIDGEAVSFLDVRLRENALACKRAGRAVPLWLMTSDATDEPIRAALKKREAGAHVRTFVQDLSLRLTEQGELFFDAQGHTSTYAPGHGDLPDALKRSGLLGDHIRAGGEYVWITNVDNLGATLDDTLLGAFVASGKELMVEVTDKLGADRGGIPVHANTHAKDHEGERLQVLEEFRLPKDFDASQVRVFNTNTFLVRADALDTTHIEWSFFEVQKKVDGKPAVQFERLLQELTAALETTYVRVPRTGHASRFLPVKDPEELARRKPEIDDVIRARLC
jgi:UTP--glucose-1-phosphate uridylyltransferase